MQPLPTAGPPSIEHELADQLGLDVTAFVETFGAGWSEAEVMHDFDADPSGGWESPFGPWYVAGRPAQLMLRVSHETIDLAVPHGEWYGVASLTLRPRHVVSLTRPAGSAACEAVVRTSGRAALQPVLLPLLPKPDPPEYRQTPTCAWAARASGRHRLLSSVVAGAREGGRRPRKYSSSPLLPVWISGVRSTAEPRGFRCLLPAKGSTPCVEQRCFAPPSSPPPRQ